MCFPCRGEKGVDCYTLWCGECGEEVAAYKGKTGRTSYSRGLDYLETLENRNEDKLVLWLHSVHHHQGRVGVEYRMRVTSTHTDILKVDLFAPSKLYF